MVPDIRRAWNASFTEARYRSLHQTLQRDAGCDSDFRVSETAIFLDQRLADDLERGAWEIFGQVTAAETARLARRHIPAAWKVPGESEHPVFLQIDFALVETEPGRIRPRLIELQGFPSLYGFQWLLARAYRECFPAVPEGWTAYFGGLDEDDYVEALRSAIVGAEEPSSVVLLEVEPEHQKTRIDFAVTRRLLGIPVVDALKVERRGRRLFYRDEDGREREIRRIYNRVIFDEVERKGFGRVREVFLGEELDATWVGHPNWYFQISKASLPGIRSEYCPPAHLVSDVLAAPPDDLEHHVLKPLFSFAGLGVELGPSLERLRALEEPEQWLLQRRIEYAPCFSTPDGDARAEVRMMFLWPDGGAPRLVNSLVRMSKGAMMGVDFNKNKTWVGASVAFHP